MTKLSEKALESLQKTFGKGSIMTLSDKPMNVDVISTGSLYLNYALGVGGFPCGRVIELYGPESSGKTTAAIHTIAEAQKEGKVCAFIDAEQAFDPTYAKNLGVDIDSLIFSQPDYGEQALDIVESLLDTGEVGVIVIDSTSALVPKAELDGEMGDFQMGLQARLLSKAMRKLSGKINRTNCLVIFISQLREKIGGYGNPQVIGIGNALKFYATQRVEVKRLAQLKDKENNVLGNVVKCTVTKNKVAPPFRTAEFTIKYGEGIDKNGEIFDLAVEMKIIDKAGSWFSYKDTRLGQGKENSLVLIEDNPDLKEELIAVVIAGLEQQ